VNDNNAHPSWQTPAVPDYSYGSGQPGPYSQPPAPPTPPRKKRTAWRWFGGLIAFLLGLVIVAGMIGTATDPGKTAELPTSITTKAGAPKTTAPPAAKKWVPLATVTGGTEKTSDTIRTTGGKIRVTWKFTQSEFMVGAIYLLDEGTDLHKDGGLPVAMIDNADSASDSIVLRKAPGEYFVQVNAANTKYTVKVEEER
jgi:hypothetical protein